MFFPKLYKNKFLNLKIDEETASYITPPYVSEQIMKILKLYFNRENIKMETIVDCTACVGGDTIGFSQIFSSVYSIEIDKKRYEMLENNVNVYELLNVITINDDCLSFLKSINYVQAIYFDPPWGGKDYKNHINLRLTINDISIAQISIDLMNNKYTKKPPIFIIFKLPKNYDIHYFFKTVSYKEEIEIYLHKLEKMYILIILNKYYDHGICMIE